MKLLWWVPRGPAGWVVWLVSLYIMHPTSIYYLLTGKEQP